jgi:3'-5' exonuclease
MEILKNIDLSRVLILDIETVPAYASYHELSAEWQHLWDLKSRVIAKEKTPEESYERASIYSEFGKVICISAGYFAPNGGQRQFRISSFYGDIEKDLLQEFASLLHRHFSDATARLCAHNGKEFDFPYLGRRMIINGITVPAALDLSGKKPWEVPHLDTMEMWKFGDYKSYTSLNLLAHALNIPTPKDDIDGSQVGRVYWEENDLERIRTYCQKDVLTVAQILMRFKGLPLLNAEEIVIRQSSSQSE